MTFSIGDKVLYLGPQCPIKKTGWIVSKVRNTDSYVTRFGHDDEGKPYDYIIKANRLKRLERKPETVIERVGDSQ